MKNLKKVLALVLAFACAFTMFAGAASFTDEADIAVDTNVVNTLIGLGVIEGYTDGSFRPDDTVTRAEMAKMIYVVRTGRSDASAYNDDATSFTDIGDHWARGYIKYCQSLGIIAGHSATRFAPDATVTTQEAAKMLLVTLGYDAERVGLVGAGWGAKTIALADENGLLKDVNCGTTQGMPRQYAAQLIYNTIFAPIVVLRDGEYSNMNALGTDKNAIVGKRYMDLETEIGVMTEIGYNDAKSEYIYTVDGADYSTASDYSDLFGMNVQVLYKVDGRQIVVYGISEYDSDVMVEGVLGDIDDFDKIDGKDEITVSDVDYKVDRYAVIYDFNNDATARTAAEVAQDTGYKAFEFKAIDNNDDNDIDVIVVYPVIVAKVNFVNNTRFGLNVTAYNSVDLEDAHTYDGMAKDDWVVVTAAKNTADDVMNVAEATVLTGKIEGKRASGNIDSILVDGNWYEEAKDGVISQNNGATVKIAVIGDIVFNCETTSDSVATSDIVLVEEAAIETRDTGLNQGSKLMGKIVKADGTIVEAEISELDDKEVVDKDANEDQVLASDVVSKVAGKLYSFSMDGDKYELTTISNSNKAGYEGVYTGQKTSDKDDGTLGGFDVADDAVIFVKGSTEDDTKVVTGATLKSWSDTTFTGSYILTVDTSSKFETVAAAYLEMTGDLPASGDTLYGYITAEPYTSKPDNTEYVNLTVWTADGEDDYIVKADNTSRALDKGDMIAFNMKADNEIELNDDMDLKTGAVTAVGNSRVQIKVGDVTDTYKITDDTVIVYVDGEDVVGIEGGSIELAIDKNATTKYANVKFDYNNDTDKEIEVIYVATNGFFGTTSNAPTVPFPAE